MSAIHFAGVSCHVCGYTPHDGDGPDGWVVQSTTVIRPSEDGINTGVSVVAWACPECGPSVLRTTVAMFSSMPLTNDQRTELAREM